MSKISFKEHAGLSDKSKHLSAEDCIKTMENIVKETASEAFRLGKESGKITEHEFGEQVKIAFSAKNSLASTNIGNIYINDYMTAIDTVVNQYMPEAAESMQHDLADMFPISNIRGKQIIQPVQFAFGGKAPYRQYQEMGKTVQTTGRKTLQFSSMSIQGNITMRAEDIQYLHSYSSFDVNGFGEYMAIQTRKALVQIMNRIKSDIYDAYQNGVITDGVNVNNFGVSSTQTFTPIIAPWGTKNLDGTITPNQTSKPLYDIASWLVQPNFILFNGIVEEILMNRPTANLLLQNESISQFTQYFPANAGIWDRDWTATLNTVFRFTVPGMPPIRITEDKWLEDNVLGLSGGAKAQYFLNDGMVLFKLRTQPGVNSPGKMYFSSAIQNGGRSGPYVATEDCTVPGSRGGLKNPFIDIVYGYEGSPVVIQPEMFFKAYVLSN